MRARTSILEGDIVVMLNLPLTLRERLGDEAAEALVAVFNTWESHVRGDVVEISAQRFERRLAEIAAQLRVEIGQLETRLTGQMAKLETEMRGAMADLETRLTGRMAALETTMTERMAALETRVVRWMFVFWAGQIAILFTFFKP